MAADDVDAGARSLGAARSRRRALLSALGGTLGVLGLTPAVAPLESLLTAEAGDKAKKRRRRRKKRTTYNPSAAYNNCLVNAPRELCAGHGCADGDQSERCVLCFTDVEGCCVQALLSATAYCACIDALPTFSCSPE